MATQHVYIYKSAKGGYVTLAKALSSENYPIGTTWQDYLDGLWVKLSKQQLAFRADHPDASIEEVWNMALNEPEQEPEQEPAPEPAPDPTLESLSENLTENERAVVIANLGLSDSKEVSESGQEHTLKPNIRYNFTETERLAVTLGTPTDGIANEYRFSFDSPEQQATQLVLPESIVWASIPTVRAGHHYEVTIIYNGANESYYGIINEW